MGFDGIGDAIWALWCFAVVSFFVSWPLALWKLFDIVLWLAHHLHITYQ